MSYGVETTERFDREFKKLDQIHAANDKGMDRKKSC